MRRITRAVWLRFLVITTACLVLVAPVHAVGTLVVTSRTTPGGVTKYTLAWTSTAGGAVSANPFIVRGGDILQVKFVPGSGGTQPSDQYDVTLVDEDSVDLLAGEGANLSNAAASLAVPLGDGERIYVDGLQRLDLVVANAGSAKTGTVIVWVR